MCIEDIVPQLRSHILTWLSLSTSTRHTSLSTMGHHNPFLDSTSCWHPGLGSEIYLYWLGYWPGYLGTDKPTPFLFLTLDHTWQSTLPSHSLTHSPYSNCRLRRHPSLGCGHGLSITSWEYQLIGHPVAILSPEEPRSRDSPMTWSLIYI